MKTFTSKDDRIGTLRFYVIAARHRMLNEQIISLYSACAVYPSPPSAVMLQGTAAAPGRFPVPQEVDQRALSGSPSFKKFVNLSFLHIWKSHLNAWKCFFHRLLTVFYVTVQMRWGAGGLKAVSSSDLSWQTKQQAGFLLYWGCDLFFQRDEGAVGVRGRAFCEFCTLSSDIIWISFCCFSKTENSHQLSKLFKTYCFACSLSYINSS